MDAELSSEARIRCGIVEATVEHYSILLGTQEVNAKAAATSANALSSVRRLGDSLCKLQTIGQAMTRVGQQWRREKQLALSTLAQHQKLLAFFEAPALLDSCIQNEMYHESLLVLDHIMRAAQRLNNLELFGRVEGEVRRTLERSLAKVVFPRLAGQLTVASAVKVTEFLKRLGVEEHYIRQLFLLKRAEYVDSLLCEAEESYVPYSRIFKYVTAFKVYVNEAILQYTACFSLAAEGKSCSELVGWCHKRAYVFVDRFCASLEKITNGTELASVIEQCCSCSATAIPLHMDVSGLINEALISRVKALFADQIDFALQSYKASMMTFSWRPQKKLQRNLGRQRDEAPATVVAAAGAACFSPPVVLLQWLPLAYALNGMLTAFNTIRKCVVPGVGLFCVTKVVELLRTMIKDLTRDKELLMAVEGSEKEVYFLFVDAFVHDFYPHVLLCVRALLTDHAGQLLVDEMCGDVEALRSILLLESGVNTSCSLPQKQEEQGEQKQIGELRKTDGFLAASADSLDVTSGKNSACV